MRSPQVTENERRAVEAGMASEAERYSDLRVMQSAAGYYVGTEYRLPDGFTQPGSRDSGYFGTRAEAQAFLDALESGEDVGDSLRMDP